MPGIFSFFLLPENQAEHASASVRNLVLVRGVRNGNPGPGPAGGHARRRPGASASGPWHGAAGGTAATGTASGTSSTSTS
jgi:hypothetical protein